MDILRKTTIDFITSNEKFLKLALEVRTAVGELVSTTYGQVMQSVLRCVVDRLSDSKPRIWTVSEHFKNGARRIRLHRTEKHWSSKTTWEGVVFVHLDPQKALDKPFQVGINKQNRQTIEDVHHRKEIGAFLEQFEKSEMLPDAADLISCSVTLSVTGSNDDRTKAIREFAERIADTMISLATNIGEFEKSKPNPG